MAHKVGRAKVKVRTYYKRQNGVRNRIEERTNSRGKTTTTLRRNGKQIRKDSTQRSVEEAEKKARNLIMQDAKNTEHKDIGLDCGLPLEKPKDTLPAVTDPVLLALSQEAKRKKRKSWIWD
jgi:hypothetical protein